MFWTPSPTVETSRVPSLRRPSIVGDELLSAGRFAGSDCALADIRLNNEAAAKPTPAPRNVRRFGRAGPWFPFRPFRFCMIFPLGAVRACHQIGAELV